MLRRRLLVFISLALLLLVSGCSGEEQATGDSPGEATPSGEAVEKIIISGLPGGAVEIAVEEIKAMPAESGEAFGITSSNEEEMIPFKGVDLNEILKLHGTSLADYSSVRLVAADGYSVEVPEDIIRTSPVYLAYELFGGPLREEARPLRVVIPGVRTLYWIKMLQEIQLISGAGVAVNSLYIFENLVEAGAEDVDLAAFLGLNEESRVTLIAADGLVKHETLEVADKSYYINRSGENAPEFYSPDIPETMYVKKVAVLIRGESAYLFAGAVKEDEESAVPGQRFLDLLAEYLATELVLNPGQSDEQAITAEELAAMSFSLTADGVVVE